MTLKSKITSKTTSQSTNLANGGTPMRPLAKDAMLDFLQAVPAMLQGRALRRVTPRLPDAAGPTHGIVDRNGQLHGSMSVLVIGESTVSGVGAATHEQALAGCLARELSRRSGKSVAWEAVGRNGARLADIGRELLPRIVETRPSLVFLVAGVNDVLQLTAPSVWGRELGALIEYFGASGCEIVVTGTPSFGQFPALKSPLREFLARRAHALDRVSAEVCRTHGATLVRFDALVLDGVFFAEDHFHPSASGYAQWANLLAESVTGNP